MTTQEQLLTHCETPSPIALLASMARTFRDALARGRARRRLAHELSLLTDRELADLHLQPHDLDRLVQGRPVPAMELMRRSR